MISISIYRNSKKDIEQFVVEGHAYAADPGQDIVCAAVSVLTQTTVLGLHEIAYDLYKSGLKSVNISLDSLKEYKYKGITRCGELKDVLKSIHKCLDLGL